MLRQLTQISYKRFASRNTHLTRTFSTTKTDDYLCVHVFVTCKPGTQDAFKLASLKNARESCKEEGIARFDVIQQVDDPCNFVLVEVYKNEDAPAKHKETEHYNVWRETVGDFMAKPRSAIKYHNIFPGTGNGWDCPKTGSLEHD